MIATNPTAATVTYGKGLQLAATVDCERGPAPSVRWASTATDVVTVDSLTGTAHAIGPGAAEILVSTVGSPTLSARVPVRVVCTLLPLYAISVSPTAVTLAPAGGAVQFTATAVATGCGKALSTEPPGVTWRSSDTSVVTIDSAGLARGGRVGVAVITAAARSNPNLIAQVTVNVSTGGAPVRSLTTSPTQLMLSATDTARVRATLVLDPSLPAGTSSAVTFASTDSCAALVDSTGLVTAVGAGRSAQVVVAARAYPSVTQSVPVTVLTPIRGALYYTLQRIAVSGTTTSVDPRAVREKIDVTANLGRLDFLGPTRVDALLGGRVAATLSLGRFVPGQPDTTFTLTIDTDRRDASGVRLFANGDARLELRAVGEGTPAFAGCPNTGTVRQASLSANLTLANP